MSHIRYFKDHVKLTGQRVIDIGAGSGAISELIAGEGALVTGVEIDRDKVRRARHSNSPKLKIIEGRSEELPVAGSSFDIASYFFSFHHVSIRAQAKSIEETHRVLIGNGLLYVVEPYPYGSMFEVVKLVEDETFVRTNSHRFLDGLAAKGELFRLISRRDYTLSRSYPTFEDFEKQVISVDPARTAEFRKNEAPIRAAFCRQSKGSILDQPCAAYLFEKIA